MCHRHLAGTELSPSLGPLILLSNPSAASVELFVHLQRFEVVSPSTWCVAHCSST